MKYNGACVFPSSGYSLGIVLPWSVNGGEYGQHTCVTIGETTICSTQDVQTCLETCAGGICDGTYYGSRTCNGPYGVPAGAISGEYVESGFTFGYCNSSGGPYNMFQDITYYKYGGIGKNSVENGSFAGYQTTITGIDENGNCVAVGTTSQDYICNSGYCKDSTTTTKCTKTSGCSGYSYSNAPSNGSLTGDSCTAVISIADGSCGRMTYRTGYSCNSGYCKNPSSSTAACYQTNYAINHGYPYYGMDGVKLGVGSTSTNYTGSGTAACTSTTVYSSFKCAWPYVKVGNTCELSSEGLSYNYYGCNSSYIAYGMGSFPGFNGVPAYMFAGDAGFRSEVLKNCAGGEVYEYNGVVMCSCSYSNSSVRGHEISGLGQFIWSSSAMTYNNAHNFCANMGGRLMKLGTYESSLTSAQVKELYNLCHNKISGVTKTNHAWLENHQNVSLTSGGGYASGNESSNTEKLCVFCKRY